MQKADWRGNAPPEYFEIRFTRRAVFKNQAGKIVKVFEIGDTYRASGCTETYFITPMGGIYFDEAEPVDERKA
jgi:hypothetical protein